MARRRLSALSCEGTLGRLVCWLCDGTVRGGGSGLRLVSRKDSAEYSEDERELCESRRVSGGGRASGACNCPAS